MISATPLAAEFYDRPAETVAIELLGKRLVRVSSAGITTGRIVETEAYLADGDPACHAAKGRNRKNAAMFGPAGRAYVYVIHARCCFNIVTLDPSQPSAVLIRAVEPLAGKTLMANRRRQTNKFDLTRGPGRLCEAFAIDRDLDRVDLTTGDTIWVDDHSPTVVPAVAIGASPRIGVTSGAELPLRYFFSKNRFVSGPRKGNIADSI